MENRKASVRSLVIFDYFRITMNGLYENVTKLNRGGTSIQNEIDELIPVFYVYQTDNLNFQGSIAGNISSDSEDDSLLPKV